MANIQSAKKRVRQNRTRAERNAARRSRIRTFLRAIERAIISKEYKNSQEALRVAQPELMRGVTKGVWNKQAASRKISRFNSLIKKLFLKKENKIK